MTSREPQPREGRSSIARPTVGFSFERERFLTYLFFGPARVREATETGGSRQASVEHALERFRVRRRDGDASGAKAEPSGAQRSNGDAPER
jgi:hypothetical protein